MLTPSRIQIKVVDPACAPARHCLHSYFAELAQRFEGGFDPGPDASTNLAAYRAPLGRFLLADHDGLPVGCIGLAGDGSPVAEVKRLWIAPAIRGQGLATTLMAATETHARALGITHLRLDTNRTLTQAIAMYRAQGWTEIPRYNDNPYADHWFAKSLPANL